VLVRLSSTTSRPALRAASGRPPARQPHGGHRGAGLTLRDRGRHSRHDPELRHTAAGIARAVFRVAVSGRREQEASFFTVVVCCDQADHAAESLARGSRVVVVGRLQQRSWTAEDGSARSVVEVVAEELGPSLRWATTTPARVTKSNDS
jgi:single stranded DNA-binding protein